MRTTPAARRSVALLATTALLSGGAALLAVPAYAALPAGEVTSFTPTSWDNRSSVTMTVKGQNFAPQDAVILHPACTTDPAAAVAPATCTPFPSSTEIVPIATTSSSYSPPSPLNGMVASLTATVDLATAAPGWYTVSVKHAFPDSTEGAATSGPNGYLHVFAYGGANASSSAPGVPFTGEDYILFDDCDILNDGCGRLPGVPLDVKGGNIAVGATLKFLLPDGTEDKGLEFVYGNPANGANNFGGNSNGTERNDAAAGTAYPSATLLQGSYKYYTNNAVSGHVPFTPGIHTLRVLNTDLDPTGAQATFVQPWYADKTKVSPRNLGRGASNVAVTVTGKGFRDGARLAPTCGSGGLGNLSDRQADGTYNTITATVSIASNAATGIDSCSLGVQNPDGGYFALPALTIGAPPVITAVSPDDTSFAHLGQGAHVGFEPGTGGGILITGSNFVGNGETDPAKMTRFDFGPDITVKTRSVGTGSALVSIDVAPGAATGRRDVKAINPDGGSSVTTQPKAGTCPACQPDPQKADLPLQINAGPKITSVTPSSFTRGSAGVPVEVVGTGFHTSIADAQVDISPTGISHAKTLATATKVTFEATTAADAGPGLRDLTITNPEDYGRAVCTGCLSVDSLGVSPSSAPNTGASGPVTLTVLQDGLPSFGTGSKVTLSHQTSLPGQPDITGTAVTPTGAKTATTVFDLTNAALGKYNVSVVLDPASVDPTTVSCSGCFSVTGNALGATTVTPAVAGQGAQGWLLTFNGSGFTKGMQVAIPDVSVRADSITFKSPTQFTALADVASTATTGNKTGTVTAGDGTSKTFAFTVNRAPVPSAVSSGAAYGQGAGSAGSPSPKPSTQVTATGTDEDPDTKLVLGPLVATSGETAVADTPPNCPLPPACISQGSPGSVKADVAVDPAAAQGKRAVTLFNPGDGGTASLADAFTVKPGPRLITISNQAGQPVLTRDGQKHTVTFDGAAFPVPSSDADKAKAFSITNLDGSAIDPSQVKVENVQFTQSQIKADITAFATRPFGAVRVAVFNPDAADLGFTQCVTCLSVASVPGLPANLGLASGGTSLTASWLPPVGTQSNVSNGAAITGYHLTFQKSGDATATSYDVSGSTLSKTFTGLLRDATYVVRVQAVNAAGAGPFASASGMPGIATKLTSGASPKLSIAGSAVRLTGKLVAGTAPVSGKAIKLTFVRSVGAAFSKTVTTNTAGGWSYVYAAPYSFSVTASFAGDTNYRPTSASKVPVSVKAKVVRTSPSSGSISRVGTTLRISGYVYPNKRGKVVYLHRYTGGRWITYAKATLTSTSTYRFTVSPSRGSYTFRVYIPTTTGNAAGVSSSFVLKRV